MDTTNLYPTILFLGSLSLIPFLIVISTSFLKISLVLLVVRNAMGIQQVPPNMAIYGIALAITVFVMAPTIEQVNQLYETLDTNNTSIDGFIDNAKIISNPFKQFMLSQVNPDMQTLFLDSARSLWPVELYQGITPDNYLILLPSFVISELQSGFKIGFLIYIPFIIIDLIVSNILLALGMQMVSPMTISLPLKMLLFVLVDGWGRLLQSLALSYS